MLKDCLEIFKKIYDKNGEAYITKDYILCEGSYILVDKIGNIKNIYEVDKENVNNKDEIYMYFVQRDYLSKLIDMNKPIDPNKTIHSNNYLSFFVKKDSMEGKLTNDMIDNYYNILLNPMKKYREKEKRKMYEQVENLYGRTSEEKINLCKNWVINNIHSLIERVKKDNKYMKIFFEADIEEYKIESEKYVIPNIYNNAQYNLEINNTTYGVPNNNISFNAKKPYLENKARRYAKPYLISIQETLLQKKFFDFLMNSILNGKINIYINENNIKAISNNETLEEDFYGYFLSLKKGKEVEIHDFDTITDYKFKINDLNIEMVIPVYYTKESQNLKYKKMEDINDLKAMINIVYFNKYLTSNYFTEAKNLGLNDIKIKENLVKSRNAFFNWFYKGQEEAIKQIFYKVSMDLIKNSLANDYGIRAKEQFNLMCCILKHFGRAEKMADILSTLANRLREKINSGVTDKIDSDDEYYFAVGQTVSYLISLNKSSKKKHFLINPILNCKDNRMLKNEVNVLFRKYSYAIRKDNKRFNNLRAMVLGYEPEGQIKEDILVAGYLYSSLIYESSKDVEKLAERRAIYSSNA